MSQVDPAPRDGGTHLLLANVILLTILLPWSDITEVHFLIFRCFAIITVGIGLWRVLGQKWPLQAVAVVLPLILLVGRHYQVALILAGIAYAFIIYKLLSLIFSHEKVTHHTVATALTVFLLIDLFFTIVYSVVEFANPGAIVGVVFHPGALGPFSAGDMLYFSTCTLTTVGYGDIRPYSHLARSLVSFEALTGVLFPSMLLARLIGLYETHRREDGEL